MMLYDKYERGRQHLNGGHQRITYEPNKQTNKQTSKKKHILRLTQSNQWVGVDHAARMHLLNSPPMTSSVEENKMAVMITMMITIIIIRRTRIRIMITASQSNLNRN